MEMVLLRVGIQVLEAQQRLPGAQGSRAALSVATAFICVLSELASLCKVLISPTQTHVL